MSPAALYGLAAWALLAGTAATFLPRCRRLPTAAGMAALALLPILAGESLAMMLHGAFATPSFTLVQLAVWRIAGSGRLERPGFRVSAILVAAALAFYSLALGLGPFDPYGLGYRPLPILLALVPLAGWLAWRRYDAWLAILGFDLLAYATGLFGNLWDALFDPALVLLAAAALCRCRLSRPQPGRSAA